MAEYELACDLNMRSQLVTTEAAIPHMRERGAGSLVYTASTAGIMGSPMSPVYSMVKHGIVGFVRSLAKRLGPDNIRVNAICPGPFATPLNEILLKDPPRAREMIARVPMDRWGDPAELATAALYYASAASSFTTGSTLVIDGGYTTQ